MAPMKTMKAMKAMKSGSKVMTKGALVKTLAEKHEMKTKACAGLLESLVALATTEVKKTGIFRQSLRGCQGLSFIVHVLC